MPNDWIASSRQPPEILPETREQRNLQFDALVETLTEDQQELVLLMLHALQPDKARKISNRPDGELIRQCNRLHAVRAATDLAYEVIPEGNERQLSAALEPLNARRLEIQARLFALAGPTTQEGARATAWALLDQCPDGLAGAVEDADLARWLAIHCAEYLVRGLTELDFRT